VAEAEARLSSARVALADASLRAPADGLVVRRLVDPGAVVAPGAPLLVFVADGATRLVVEPDESNLALLEVGQRALASADAFPDRAFPARLSWIAPAVDPARGTVEVRLEVPRPPAYLRADMTVSVEIEVARVDDGLTVPASA